MLWIGSYARHVAIHRHEREHGAFGSGHARQNQIVVGIEVADVACHP